MSKIQLYIGTDLLDFNGKVNVKRQVNDYRNPSIGGNVTSYTLDVPLTRTNRPLLGFIDDIRSRVEVTETARLVADGMEIIQGKLRVLRANTNRCVIIIEGNDWMNDISGVSIQDLSWAGGDAHTFTAANVLASWTAGAGAFYRYPLINFGITISEGYGSGGTELYPADFYPMFNIAGIVTKLFLDAGYTLDGSGFFAGAFGQALYLLAKPVVAVTEFLEDKLMDVYVDDDSDNYDSDLTGGGAPASVSIDAIVDFDAKTTDEGNDFNTSNNTYIVPATGTYRFQAQIKVYSTMNQVGGSWTVTSLSLDFAIRSNDVDLVSVVSSSNDAFDAGNETYLIDTGYIYLESGDDIDCYLNMTVNGTNDTGGSLTAELYVMNGAAISFFNNVWGEQNLWPGKGYSITPAEFLPDIDGLDLLRGLREFANLRFWMDRNNRTAYIETSNDFYGSTVIDWSDKIDYSQLPVMEVISSNYKEKQKFLWKADAADRAYIDEVAVNGIPFTKELTLSSEYIQAGFTDRENRAFYATVNADMLQIGHSDQYKVARIYGNQEDATTRPFPADRAKSWQPRLLEWQGLVALTVGNFDWMETPSDLTPTNYTTFPRGATPDMNDMFDDYMLKDWRRIEKNKIVTVTLKLTSAEIMKFMTVVGTAANEGFRATYIVNIEGIDMTFIVSGIVTDGDRVKAELIQKM